MGQDMRQYRLEKGFSMQAVAKKVGLHYTTLLEYEKGRRSPTGEIVKKLAKFYRFEDETATKQAEIYGKFVEKTK